VADHHFPIVRVLVIELGWSHRTMANQAVFAIEPTLTMVIMLPAGWVKKLDTYRIAAW